MLTWCHSRLHHRHWRLSHVGKASRNVPKRARADCSHHSRNAAIERTNPCLGFGGTNCAYSSTSFDNKRHNPQHPQVSFAGRQGRSCAQCRSEFLRKPSPRNPSAFSRPPWSALLPSASIQARLVSEMPSAPCTFPASESAVVLWRWFLTTSSN